MELYHVTTLRLLNKYLESGHILPPVRAWKSLEGATRFAKQTGRRLVIRLTTTRGNHFRLLGGHLDQAMVSDTPYPVLEDDFE